LNNRKTQVERRRAGNLFQAIEGAANEGIPIRLVVFESAQNRVQYRTLDQAHWAVVIRDFNTGDYVLRRGALPVNFDKPDNEAAVLGFEEGQKLMWFKAHRKREARLRASKIKEALDKNHGRLLCEVPRCGFDFVERYGELGTGFAHVHHKTPLSEGPDEGRIVSLQELAIVCPNCHAMIHVRGECRPMEALIPAPDRPEASSL
jgi:5-methylcytosine-specific restriction protein A